MSSDPLFGPSFSSAAMLEVMSASSWVQAMLDVEAALARAEAKTGMIPAEAADAIAAHCRANEFDIAELGSDAADSANPANPLVSALRSKVSQQAAPYVHRGATSQDIIDTAMMLLARRGIALILEDLEGAADASATLAEHHRSTVMAARTLMQQALVTSFGLKAASWLVSIVEAGDRLAVIGKQRLALQFGGAVGTLAALGVQGPAVSRELARLLDLREPVMPWHAARERMAELGSALATATGTAGKVALDIVLMAQTEVGEVREPAAGGRGGSSTMPQKQNPVWAVEILAAARAINGPAAVLQAAILQEHERAAGAWQSEWPAFAEAFRLAGGAAWRLKLLLSSLEIDAERMRTNLDASGGSLMAESLVTTLAARINPIAARKLVEAAVEEASRSRRRFRQVVKDDPLIVAQLPAGEVEAALDPARYLGASDAFIARALDLHEKRKRDGWAGSW
ncbi:MAG TPA: 3-carboxy-cis,cis-muconate cycloisomerase [Candidatus Angelobacter sp.]|nr:3-carboxy-cis,cis-muconate cycloisomerase [Candidatus Angelobacter sp.]